jgi:hypothetical protein
MTPGAIKDWLVPLSTFVTLITASIGGWMALRDYRLRVRAETRLAQSEGLEADIKLLKLFTEIMNIAHGRGGSQVSEGAVEKILSPEAIKELGAAGRSVRDILQNAVVDLPIGVAAQDAAICAIWVLGSRHEVLAPVAIQALTSLTGFKAEVASPYLEELKQRYKGFLPSRNYP